MVNNYFQYIFCFFIIVIYANAEETTTKEKIKKFVPPGMNPDMFPEPTYDPNAPECTTYREPCGFYSFSLHGRTPFKWVKSWCRCASEQECIYDRTDMKMRLYRQVCVPRDKIPEDDYSEHKYIYF
jgi:hypothetical protein